MENYYLAICVIYKKIVIKISIQNQTIQEKVFLKYNSDIKYSFKIEKINIFIKFS